MEGVKESPIRTERIQRINEKYDLKVTVKKEVLAKKAVHLSSMPNLFDMKLLHKTDLPVIVGFKRSRRK